jgi:hypothetical protein
MIRHGLGNYIIIYAMNYEANLLTPKALVDTSQYLNWTPVVFAPWPRW